MHPVIAIPLAFMLMVVIALGLLLVVGIVWLFHHHHLRPLFGGVLLLIGALCFFGMTSHRAWQIQEAQEAQLTHAAEKERAEARVGTPDELGSRLARQAELPDTATIEGDDDRQHTGKEPDWLSERPHSEYVGGREMFLMHVVSGPYSTKDECKSNLIPAVQEAATQFASEHLSELGQRLTIEPAFAQQLILKRYMQPVTTTLGRMYELHAQIGFDDRARSDLQERARNIVVNDRLRYTALGGGGLLLVLGLAYAGLRATAR